MSLFAPAQHMVPPQQSLSNVIPFGIRQDLIVQIPINPRVTADLYIDKFIGLTSDIEGLDNTMRLKQAPLLEVSATAKEVSEFKHFLEMTWTLKKIQ